MAISITFSDLTQVQATRLCHYAGMLDLPLPESPPTGGIPVSPSHVEAVPPNVMLTADKPKRGRPRKAKNMDAEPIGATAVGSSGGPPYVAPAGESAAGTSSPEPTGLPCPAPAGVSAAGKSSATVDDVRAALTKVMKKHGFDGCNKVLKAFCATRMSEIPEDKYAEFVAAAEKEAQA